MREYECNSSEIEAVSTKQITPEAEAATRSRLPLQSLLSGHATSYQSW